MTLNPIIESKIEEFKDEYSLNGTKDEIFEQYVNLQIIKRKYPDFSSDPNLFDKVCVGGGNDIGLDGIIISINDQPVASLVEAKDIIENRSKISIDVTFIQSKNKASFEQKEFAVFKDGIENFLKESIDVPVNDSIKEWHLILEEISKRENLRKWKKTPNIYVYYVTTGKWNGQEYIVSAIKTLKDHIQAQKTYEVENVFCVDAESLLKIIGENEDDYITTIKVDQKIGLPKVNGVDSSSVYLCRAENLMELLRAEDGNLRRNLFEDNVRDFQGYTNINEDVKKTIVNKPDQFLLLNNGITIVCGKMNDPNMELTLEAPQIVNGCQTCNILYDCMIDGYDLKSVYVVLKVIASRDDEIVNNVVKGTNRQNIVYEEALETTRVFHKRLEEFFAAYGKMTRYPKLFYERRSKQYQKNHLVKVTQKVNLKLLTQGFVSLFLSRPDLGIRHEIKLLKLFRTQLFQESESFYPYYTAAFICKGVDNLFRDGKLPRSLKAYELHISFIMKELIMNCEKMPQSFNGKQINDYCERLLSKVEDPAVFIEYARKSCDIFDDITEKWIKNKGEKFKDARKDREEFTTYIIEYLKADNQKGLIVGKIIKIGNDKYGNIYGFIQNEPENLFFHSANQNESVDFSYEGRCVSFEMGKDDYGEPTPINIRLVSE